jgi:predicted GH43/DUF377 family glycosyl hydrolase
MIEVKKEGIVLSRSLLDFELEGVLNPAVIKEDNVVHMFYRAVALGNFSTIGYCQFSGPLSLKERNDKPLIIPEFDYESHGVEDPRIVKIEDTYYLSYTAYNGVNALGALAISKDMIHWEKKGIVVPQITFVEFKELTSGDENLNEKYLRYNEHNRILEIENQENCLVWDKNLIFFPRRIGGKLFFLHRIKPDIQMVAGIDQIADLTPAYWKNYFTNFDDCIVLTPKYRHEVSYIGGGCPPIETKNGWLIIYHSVHDTINGYVYSACAALLDLENPQKELSRLPYPLFAPSLDWETQGEVNNVCFPTGTALFDDRLYIYYGAADSRIAAASVSLSELLLELLAHATKLSSSLQPKNSVKSY